MYRRLRTWAGQLGLGLLLTVTLLMGLGWVQVAPAQASIQQIEETADQVVYQSRQKLYDRNTNVWQAIAFKRIKSDGSDDLKLRLVGFPGAVELAHPQPLSIQLPGGEVLTAADVSEQPFTDQAPTSNVGQYDLQPVVEQLPERFEVILVVPTVDGTDLKLGVSPLAIQEWQDLASRSS